MNAENPFLEPGSEPSETDLVFVLLPGSIEPVDRESRFGDPLDAELRVAGIGYVSGGGSLLSAPDENDRTELIYAGVDVDTLDVGAARELLRDHLPDLGCPAGTRVQYGGEQDRYDGARWHVGERRDEDI